MPMEVASRSEMDFFSFPFAMLAKREARYNKISICPDVLVAVIQPQVDMHKNHKRASIRMRECTYETSPNIAVIKYWGKRDYDLNLPANSSISMTMDEQLRTSTKVRFDEKLGRDRLVLNGREARLAETARVIKVLDLVRKKAKINMHALVTSENNFPTAAGIASSASGFAALALAACDAAGLRLGAREVSMIARIGSGSATRSVFGGFAEWKAGARPDGRDSYAIQIAPATHWPELRNVVAIVDAGRKKIGSEEGMKITASTSRIYPMQLKGKPRRLTMMKSAIMNRDIAVFATIAMEDSDLMHLCMKDSRPSIVYLNGTSQKIKVFVRNYNAKKNAIVAGYTFDAGPNAHIYTTAKYAGEIALMLKKMPGVKKVIICRVGNGPKKIA
jgi:diphosphomevalonate decarboxylase